MTKKRLTSLLGLLLVMVVAACASLQIPEAGADSAPPAGTQVAAQDLTASTIAGQLAMGTLNLEGGELAVSAEQAADLLPLWKAVNSLSASQTASVEEIDALYIQIEESMTAEQVQAIKTMALGQEEVAAIMEKYGVQIQTQPGGGNPISEEQRATRVAQFQAEGKAADGRGFPEGGMMPPEGGMPDGGGDWTRQAGATPGAQRTFVPGQSGRAGRGMNTIFVDPLIALLQERVKE